MLIQFRRGGNTKKQTKSAQFVLSPSWQSAGRQRSCLGVQGLKEGVENNNKKQQIAKKERNGVCCGKPCAQCSKPPLGADTSSGVFYSELSSVYFVFLPHCSDDDMRWSLDDYELEPSQPLQPSSK